jgi:hypothetical protein
MPPGMVCHGNPAVPVRARRADDRLPDMATVAAAARGS